MPPNPPAPAPSPRPMRADARRNYERILAAAEHLVAEQGADVSLEEVARAAGVGSATLHRHFPARQTLLEAVFEARVSALCAKAADLSDAPSPEAALTGWLHAVGAHAVANRGLGAALIRGAREGTGGDPAFGESCHTMITTAGALLLDRARAAKAVRPDVTIAQLLKLVSAIALSTETEPDGPAEADRLISLALTGIRPAPR